MPRLRIEFDGPILFSHELEVRISDLNYGNHLGHDSLVSLLHEVRARFFRHHRMAETDIDGAGILLVDLAVTYRAQVFYGQTLRVEVALGELTARGCDLLYRVSDPATGGLVAVAKTGLVFFDYQAQKLVPVPERFRAVTEGVR